MRRGGGKLLSSPAIQFKGTGWYITDYAKSGKTESGGTESANAAKAEAKSETKTDTKSDAKSDTKSASLRARRSQSRKVLPKPFASSGRFSAKYRLAFRNPSLLPVS